MPTVHLKDGTSEDYDRVVVKEHGIAVGTSGSLNAPQVVYPFDQIERIDVDDDIYEDSYILQEEYGETREARPDERGESVTEYKPENRVMSELHIE